MLNLSLTPVRRPVPLGFRRTRESTLRDAFAGYGIRTCGSGTQALAMALADARRRSQSSSPEAILPAYGCPDLITACVHANVRPRLVDIRHADWGYDLASLAAGLTEDTVAVVTVNLLGAGDQAQELRRMTSARGVALIQDSAQHLPVNLPHGWHGDYVILSFGRGKPLNLLRGGALLFPQGRDSALDASQTGVMGGVRERLLASRLAGVLFNSATHPLLFGLSRRLASSNLGATRYKSLTRIEAGSPAFVAQLCSALPEYCRHPGYDVGPWRGALKDWARRDIRIVTASASASLEESPRVRLRLPLLAPSTQLRDALVAEFQREGLGATTMYGRSLDQVMDVPAEVTAQGPFPNAADFAGRLLTLPTHALVTESVVERARTAFDKVIGRSGPIAAPHG